MLGIFKKNIGLQCIVIFLMAAALWAGSFISPVPMVASTEYAVVYDLVYQLLHNQPFVSTVIAFVLIVVEGVWLNVVLYNNKMQSQVNLFPAAMYILLMSIVPGGQNITPMVLVNFAILAAMTQLLQSKMSTLPLSRNFSCALFIGVGILCYWEAIWLLIPILIIYPLMKLYTWRNWAVLILGLLAPFVLLLGYNYMWGDVNYNLFLIAHEFELPTITIDMSDKLMTASSFIFLALVLVSWFSFNQYYNRQIQLKKINANILLLPMLASFIWCFYGELLPINTQLFAVSVPYLLLHFFCNNNNRRPWIYEIIFDVFLCVGVLNIYLH